MTYKWFTAQELYCMAEICHKKALYGIPNGFEMLPEEEIAQAKVEVLDSLLSRQITEMDMDGKTILADMYYQKLIDSICDCDACLTVNDQFGVDRSEDVVLWKTGAGYLRADVIDDCFVFVSEDKAGIKAYLSTLSIQSTVPMSGATVTIPQIALAKAKRALADGKEDDAMRALLQNGADTLLDTVLSGLKGEADYLGLLLMVNKPREEQPQQLACLCAKGVLISLTDAVLNYRNCTRFSACSEKDVSARMNTLSDRFLAPVKEAMV